MRDTYNKKGERFGNTELICTEYIGGIFGFLPKELLTNEQEEVPAILEEKDDE